MPVSSVVAQTVCLSSSSFGFPRQAEKLTQNTTTLSQRRIGTCIVAYMCFGALLGRSLHLTKFDHLST